MHKNTNYQAFTLIELAIVLVIVGLIVGGVLAGQALIEVAKVRSTTSKIEKYQAAVVAFRGKYEHLPGDIPTAINFFPAAPSCPTGSDTGTCDGNGDGYIYLDTYTGSERTYFWQHLGYAGLVEGQYASNWPAGRVTNYYVPTLPIAPASLFAGYAAPYSVMWYNSFGNKHYFFIGTLETVVYTSNYIDASELSCAIIKQMDDKLDDGRPGLGKFQVSRHYCNTDNDEAGYETAQYDVSNPNATGMASLQLVLQ